VKALLLLRHKKLCHYAKDAADTTMYKALPLQLHVSCFCHRFVMAASATALQPIQSHLSKSLRSKMLLIFKVIAAITQETPPLQAVLPW
jgi:hypothetical protein